MGKSQKKQAALAKKKQQRLASIVGIFAALVVLGIGGWLVFRPKTATTAKAEPTLDIGHAAYCMRRPRFVASMGFSTDRPGMATALAGYMGFVMFDPNTGNVAQHPTWDNAGFLGGSVRDALGNTYIYPAPFGSTEHNPPDEQNKLYIIDTNSGEMTEWLDLPALAEPTETVNPYGITGLFIDCDTNSLYVASVMGSTAREEFGRIFQIDITTKTVVDTYDNIDALGVGVHNGVDGKRLLFGLARNSAIMSLPLDPETGNFDGEPQREFFLAELEGGGNDKGQRISFPLINTQQEGNMVIKGIEFDFTLRAAGVVNLANYEFRYLPDGSWDLVNIDRVTQ